MYLLREHTLINAARSRSGASEVMMCLLVHYIPSSKQETVLLAGRMTVICELYAYTFNQTPN